MTAEIPLLTPAQQHARTFYNLHGDWFGWTCVGITGLMLLRRLAGRFGPFHVRPESTGAKPSLS